MTDERLLAAVVLAVVGALLGSFFNTVTYRLPRGKSLWGRSRCPNCGRVIRWYHNVPVFSYLFLKGRCAHCGWKIPVRYLLVELLATLFSFVLPLTFPLKESLWLWPLFMISIPVTVMDVEHQLVHDAFPAVLFLWSIISVLCRLSLLQSVYFPLAGCAICFATVILLRIITRGMIGTGDAVLAAGIGSFLGPVYGMYAIAFSFPLAVIVLLPLLFYVGGRRWIKMKIPFAPFMCASAILTAILVLKGVA